MSSIPLHQEEALLRTWQGCGRTEFLGSLYSFALTGPIRILTIPVEQS